MKDMETIMTKMRINKSFKMMKVKVREKIFYDFVKINYMYLNLYIY
jgi:hypothetical protein